MRVSAFGRGGFGADGSWAGPELLESVQAGIAVPAPGTRGTRPEERRAPASRQKGVDAGPQGGVPAGWAQGCERPVRGPGSSLRAVGRSLGGGHSSLERPWRWGLGSELARRHCGASSLPRSGEWGAFRSTSQTQLCSEACLLGYSLLGICCSFLSCCKQRNWLGKTQLYFGENKLAQISIKYPFCLQPGLGDPADPYPEIASGPFWSGHTDNLGSVVFSTVWNSLRFVCPRTAGQKDWSRLCLVSMYCTLGTLKSLSHLVLTRTVWGGFY